MEECSDVEQAVHEPTPQNSEDSAGEEAEAKVESESDDEGTEDEYIAGTDKAKGKGVGIKVWIYWTNFLFVVFTDSRILAACSSSVAHL